MFGHSGTKDKTFEKLRRENASAGLEEGGPLV